MIDRLSSLSEYLKNIGLVHFAAKVGCIIKICSMPGVDSPAEEVDVKGIDEALKHIGENPGLFIWLDNPKGSKKRFGQKKYKRMPFHYGEFTEVNNPADDMGWDIIIAPSSEDSASLDDESGNAHVARGHNLTAVGYVPVNDSQEDWTKNTSTEERPEGKKAPIGNDKVILALDGNVTSEDRRVIEDFFSPMWNFKDIVWL